MTKCLECGKTNTALAEGMCIDCLKQLRPDTATLLLGIMREEERLQANQRYFNPALWEKEQLLKIIEKYQAAARNLLLARFRDGECDVVALLNFESEINEISEDLQKTEISL